LENRYALMKLKPFSRAGNRRIIFPIGIVTAINVARGQIVVKTDTGPKVEVLFDDQTTFHRVEPGAKNLRNARPIHASDIGIGDRVLVRGFAVTNRTTFAARSVFARATCAARGTRSNPTARR